MEKIELALSLALAPKKKWPIIVGGFYRSGTTLLRRLLDAHPNIHCPPEIKFFKDFYGDYLNDPLGHGRFFSTVRSCGLSTERILEIFGNAYLRVRETASKEAGKRRWADKNPENSKFVDSWDALLHGKFFFLHVLRNPCDIISSLREVNFYKTVPPDLDGQLEMLAEHWSKALCYLQAHTGKSLVIEYERLVQSPEDILKQMFAFIREDFDPRVILEFNSTARGRGIEDPKIDLSPSIHINSVNRFHKDLGINEIKSVQERLEKTYATFRQMALK